MESIWLDKTKILKNKKLNGKVKTNILIIGGGIAGILCAYMFDNMGLDYTLVEAGRICNGVTKDTTAKITLQHRLIYNKLIKMFGYESAKVYLKANQKAIEKYNTICGLIDCDFEVKDSFVYSVNDRDKLEKEILALDRLNVKSEFIENIDLPFPIVGAIKVKDQVQFNPLKFIEEISKDLNIYENTFIKKIENNHAFTDNGEITADKIIITTHFPFINRHGSYFLKMYQNRSYVVAIDNAPNINGMYIDESETGMSFRNYKDLLFVGGGSHRTGKSGGNWLELEKFIKKYYPKSSERYRWSTQDCITLDGIPYIGNYSKNTPDLYVATGFNKWGMTSSMISAMILSDLVLGKDNEYAEVFSPSRSILRPQLAINAAEAIKNLMTISKKRCSHMGCALKWNKYEHSWDCPCHGSRFSEEGSIINNPAMQNIKI